MALGTDGFGLSEARDDLRDHFELSSGYIAWAAIVQLYHAGSSTLGRLNQFRTELQIPFDKLDPTTL